MIFMQINHIKSQEITITKAFKDIETKMIRVLLIGKVRIIQAQLKVKIRYRQVRDGRKNH